MSEPTKISSAPEWRALFCQAHVFRSATMKRLAVGGALEGEHKIWCTEWETEEEWSRRVVDQAAQDATAALTAVKDLAEGAAS